VYDADEHAGGGAAAVLFGVELAFGGVVVDRLDVCNTVQLLSREVYGWVLRPGSVGVMAAFDVPLGYLALDHAGCGAQPTASVCVSHEQEQEPSQPQFHKAASAHVQADDVQRLRPLPRRETS